MTSATPTLSIPFFRPSLTDAEIQEVADTLRSGWLTTGPKTKLFEERFAEFVGSKHAIALNSCTAALHLAVEALDLKPGQGVLVPTMTFAATAEVVRYQGAVPILVDCDPLTLNMSLEDAEQKLRALRSGSLPRSIPQETPVVGLMPVHVGGLMMDPQALRSFAEANGLWMIEDAAHALPAAWRPGPEQEWVRCGAGTASVTCFSFYANKTITTGEGGMAVTDSDELAERIRMMSLHGLSRDAWKRYSTGGSWDYKIMAPGYKYNLTDIASAIGIHQLARAEQMRREREALAHHYLEAFSDTQEIELPPEDANRIHSWHLFPIKLRLERLAIDRDRFMEELKQNGVNCSVHWRPLHRHPYYQETFDWRPEDFPIATAVWKRLITLPIFPGMHDEEIDYVISTIKRLCRSFAQ
jgi:perosamine synthetase